MTISVRHSAHRSLVGPDWQSGSDRPALRGWRRSRRYPPYRMPGVAPVDFRSRDLRVVADLAALTAGGVPPLIAAQTLFAPELLETPDA